PREGLPSCRVRKLFHPPDTSKSTTISCKEIAHDSNGSIAARTAGNRPPGFDLLSASLVGSVGSWTSPPGGWGQRAGVGAGDEGGPVGGVAAPSLAVSAAALGQRQRLLGPAPQRQLRAPFGQLLPQLAVPRLHPAGVAQHRQLGLAQGLQPGQPLVP